MADREKRILIVEDEGIVAEDIRSCLEDAGFTVAGVAASADDALQEASATPPDLVLMDIRLQGELDGIEVADMLYRRFGSAIVYLTAHGDKETIERAKKTYPLGFLLKPFKPGELINVVEFALEKAAAERRERERDRAALHESTERFRNLVDILPAGVCVCDPAGVITFYNERAAQLWGRHPAAGETEEHFCAAFGLRRPGGEPLPYGDSPMSVAIAEGRTFRDEQIVIERPGGSAVHALVNIVPLAGADGAVHGAINAFIDITGLKRTEEELVAANRRLAFLSETAAGLLSAADPAALLRTLSEWLRELLAVEYAFYFAGEGAGPLQLAVHHGLPEDAEARLGELACGETFCARASASRRPVVIDRVQESSDETAAALRPLGIAAYACFPLIARERLIGALAFASRSQSEFPEEDVALLGSVADQFAIALDRKAAEEAQRLSEEHLAMALKAGRSGSFEWNAKTNVTVWSDDLLALYGILREELGPRYEDWLECLLPEDRPAGAAAVKRAIETGDYTADFRIRRLDNGEIRWMHARGEMLYDAAGRPARMIGINVDISERKRVEEALRESEQRYRLLVEANPLGVIFAEVQGGNCAHIVAANDAFLRMLGYSREELESGGLGCADLTPPEYRDLDEQSIAEARERGHSRPYEKEFIRKDGSRVPVMVARAVVGERRDQLVGFVADLTERKRTEQALREAQRLESIGLLAGGIAHDFNNLLTSILGNASLLRMEPAAGNVQWLDAIIESAEKGAALTRQLLAYAGKGRFQIADFDIATLVRSSAELLRVSIPKNVDVRFEVPRALPAVRGDGSQIQQVLMNLVINAAEAIENREGGRVHIGACTRDLDAASAARTGSGVTPGCYVAVTVEDNGCGMDERTARQIFEPFFTTKFTGRGLGLAAVHGILRSHKGTIAVESNPGRGSTFTVYLPCSEARAATPPGAGDPVVAGRQSATVLVVDDEESVRAFTESVLKRLGHNVLLAVNGRQALDLLNGHAEVDLVLLDIVMPALGGSDAFLEMRRRWPRLPVLVSSGYSREEAQRLGIPDDLPFIEKPYTVQRLAAAIEKILEAARDAATARTKRAS